MNVVIQYIFLIIFAATAAITLLGVVKIPPFDKIEKQYLNTLFKALLLQSIGIVLIAGKTAFFGPTVELSHYNWKINYPRELKSNFEELYLADSEFIEFYNKYKNTWLSTIEDIVLENDELPNTILNKYVDYIFVIKKAEEFANDVGKGELFIIQRGDGPMSGKAVLTFPGETEAIAFDVTTSPKDSDEWELTFEQPDRFVEFQGRINKWKGGLLTVKFARSGGRWTGNLTFNGVDVGRFSLDED